MEAGSLGLGIDERVVALGDFNGDQLCAKRVLSWRNSLKADPLCVVVHYSLDVVTLDGSGRKVTVHVWDHSQSTPRSTILRAETITENFIFRDGASFIHSEQIYNVVPGDFTRDGTLDLLVMSRAASATEIKMELYIGITGLGFGELLCTFIPAFVLRLLQILHR